MSNSKSPLHPTKKVRLFNDGCSNSNKTNELIDNINLNKVFEWKEDNVKLLIFGIILLEITLILQYKHIIMINCLYLTNYTITLDKLSRSSIEYYDLKT